MIPVAFVKLPYTGESILLQVGGYFLSFDVGLPVFIMVCCFCLCIFGSDCIRRAEEMKVLQNIKIRNGEKGVTP